MLINVLGRIKILLTWKQMYKQIFTTLDKDVWERAKEKSLDEEKRSLTGQFRKIYSDLPDDEEFLQVLGERFQTLNTISVGSQDAVNLTLKFPDDEFWQARIKSSKAKMMVKEFTICLIETWVDGKLGEILSDVENIIQSRKKGQKDVVRKAS